MARGGGFEPPFADPKSAVLPVRRSPIKLRGEGSNFHFPDSESGVLPVTPPRIERPGPSARLLSHGWCTSFSVSLPHLVKPGLRIFVGCRGIEPLLSGVKVRRLATRPTPLAPSRSTVLLPLSGWLAHRDCPLSLLGSGSPGIRTQIERIKSAPLFPLS
jgi:hypothetical protein